MVRQRITGKRRGDPRPYRTFASSAALAQEGASAEVAFTSVCVNSTLSGSRVGTRLRCRRHPGQDYFSGRKYHL